MKKIAVLLFLLIVFGAPAFAQSDTLREIIVGRISLRDSLWNDPSPTTVLTSAALKRQTGIDISQAINLTPGVLMQSGTLNTNRITIRGIGARTPFGSNRVRAFYGFIPLTSGDSETTVEDLNLTTIGSAEIIRGPMSSVYGAGLGGAILLHPATAPDRTALSVDNTFGSFGLLKNGYQFSYGGTTGNILINHHTLNQDGWRQNSTYSREGTTLSTQLFKKDKRALTILANSTWVKAFLPSSINREDFENHPDRAAPTWLAAKGYEQYRSHLLGASYQDAISTQWSFAAAGFISGKDGYEPRPFDILEQLTSASGLRGQISGNTSIANQKIEVLVGGEYFSDRVNSAYFENLYDDTTSGSVQGGPISSDVQRRHLANFYGRFQTALSFKLELQAGLNVNATNFSLNTGQGESNRYRYDPIWSPQTSIVYRTSQNAQYQISMGGGFSLPSLSETLTAEGVVNPNIKPETGWTFETGGKWRLWQKRLSIEATIFHMMIRDLLVARRIDDDQYVGINAGKTVHTGIEIGAVVQYPLNENWKLDATISGSFGRYRFKEFKDAESDYSGNLLTGVPNAKINAAISLRYADFFIQPGLMAVSDMYANDANTKKAAGYVIADIKSGVDLRVLKNLNLSSAIGVNNVLDAKYASMLAVNALSNGGAPRYFYPGAPRSFYFQISATYRM